MVFQKRFSINTSGHGQMQDITNSVDAIVRDSGISIGTVHVFNIGSTGAIGTIVFEPGLQRDLPMILDRLMPPSRQYGHEKTWHDSNGHSHLQATTLEPSISVPVNDGAPVLGTWQQIFHLECDIKPRSVRPRQQLVRCPAMPLPEKRYPRLCDLRPKPQLEFLPRGRLNEPRV